MGQLKMYHTMEKIEDYPVKEGFTIRNYQKGDEGAWTEICVQGDLCNPCDDDTAFRDCTTGIFPTIVPERDVFFACRDGEPVATLTAFIRENGHGDIHMVAALESARGNNLNRAMLSAGLQSLDRQMTYRPRITALTTDDERLPAIVGYLKAGFLPVNYELGMYDRWKKICDQLDIHGVEMLNDEGERTGIIL
ncbi:MAG: GNAT family N-acetyltransferase [Clostridia bacterium]|nr:GNAT family N-acetyltransferase [Clostridia bacterium]